MTALNHLLIIGTVWPEPKSSAAGSRMLQLIDLFLELDYSISFASPTLKSEHAFDLKSKGISCYEIKINNAEFDIWVKRINPTHVMFDRFMMEEQFGCRVAEHCPKAFRIIDTEDLHGLRKVRQACFKRNTEFSIDVLKEAEITKREVASILRSDLSIVISTFEMDLLITHFQIPKSKIYHLPLFVEKSDLQIKSFQERQHFMTIGSFRHEPNVDSVLYLKKEIWPEIRKQLPDVQLHIYGSYPKQQITQLNNPKQGFIVKGWAKEAFEVIGNAKVMLAPLRFGAGQKGKFIDALACGTPSVTTSIGAEGMGNKNTWCGCIADSKEELVNNAIEMYTNEAKWKQQQNKALKAIECSFSKAAYQLSFKNVLLALNKDKQPFYVELLNYHSVRNSKYMSKWIEEKNKE